MRVGDIIEVVGAQGTMRSIGVRSCVIQRADGTEVLVPNSTFVENSVTNLTYSTKQPILVNGRSPLRLRCPDSVKIARTGCKGTRFGDDLTSGPAIPRRSIAPNRLQPPDSP
jgi:Mechanosensitive ion channel